MMSFSLYTVACGAIPKNKTPGSKPNGAGMDASAIHGRPGAQVALLQSPILPAVSSPYIKRGNFRGLPVDKPHTSIPRLLLPRSVVAVPGRAARSVSRFNSSNSRRAKRTYGIPKYRRTAPSVLRPLSSVVWLLPSPLSVPPSPRPSGTNENSPRFQSWVSAFKPHKSRQGRSTRP